MLLSKAVAQRAKTVWTSETKNPVLAGIACLPVLRLRIDGMHWIVDIENDGRFMFLVN
jgi:hypothetical protein